MQQIVISFVISMTARDRQDAAGGYATRVLRLAQTSHLRVG